MLDLTAIILTKNEELNIEKCLKAIKGKVKKIYVVDSFSTDKTVEIAKKYGAEVVEHEFIHYAKQFNWALDHLDIKTEWVFRLDGDEVVPDELYQEIKEELQKHKNDNVNGFLMKYKLIFMNKFLRHGGCYPFIKMTILRYGHGRFEDRAFGEHIILNDGKEVMLTKDCLHYDFKNIDAFVNKHNSYASRECFDYFNRKNINQKNLYKQAENVKKIRDSFYYKLPLFLRAKLYYIYRYYFKLGFLDGKEGKIYAMIQAYFYRFIVDAKIYEKERINNESSSH